jgi:hypothetical protein
VLGPGPSETPASSEVCTGLSGGGQSDTSGQWTIPSLVTKKLVAENIRIDLFKFDRSNRSVWAVFVWFCLEKGLLQQ